MARRASGIRRWRSSTGADRSSPPDGRRPRGRSSGSAAACPAGPTPSSPRSSPPPAPWARRSAPAPGSPRRRCSPTAVRRAEAPAAAAGDHRRGHVVPAVQRAGRRLRPRRPDDAGDARRRRVGGRRAEAVEHERPSRRPRPAARPHRLGRAQASRDHVLRPADAPAGRGGAAAPADERARLVQRGVPHRRPRAGRQHDRRAGRGLAGGDDDARPRARLRHAAPAALRRDRRPRRRARPPPRPTSYFATYAWYPQRAGTRRPRHRVGDDSRPARRSGRAAAHRRARRPAAGPRLDGAPRPCRRARRSRPWRGGLARQARRQRRRPRGRRSTHGVAGAAGCSLVPTACSTASSPRSSSACRRSRSPAAPTRSSTTSSASGCSACRANRASTVTAVPEHPPL